MIKIKKIHLINYLAHKDNTFEFDSPFFELCMPNEFGKTTLLNAIVDCFSLNPEALSNKSTKYISKEPVIELGFTLRDIYFDLILNAQDHTVILKGEDGTYLGTQEKIKNFFKKNGFLYFPFVVKHLLYLRERDLSIDAKSSEFRRFTKDILNVEKINKMIVAIDKIILKDKGFKSGKFSDLYKDTTNKLIETKDDITYLERELSNFLKNKSKFELLSKKSRDIKTQINKIKIKKNILNTLIKLKQKESIEKSIHDLKLKKKNVEHELLKIQKQKNNVSQHKSITEKELNNLKLLSSQIQKLEEHVENKKQIEENINKLNRDILDIQSQIKEVSNFINAHLIDLEKIRGEQKVLEGSLTNIHIKENQVELLYKQMDVLKNQIQKAESLNKELNQKKAGLKNYKKYHLNALRDILKDWRVYLGLKTNAQGVFKVSQGRVKANHQELSTGDSLSFKGELEISSGSFSGVIYTVQELSNLRDKIQPYIQEFIKPDKLEDVINRLDNVNKLIQDLKNLDLGKLSDEYNKINNEIQKIKKQIKDKPKLITSKKQLDEKQNKLDMELTQKKEYLSEIKQKFSAKKAKLELLKHQLSKLNIDEIKKNIEKIKLDINISTDQIGSITEIEEQIHAKDHTIKELNKTLEGLIEIQAESKEKLKSILKDIAKQQDILSQIGSLDDELNNLPYGEVIKFQDKTIEELSSIKQGLDGELEDKLKENELLSVNLAELKGILSHVPSEQTLEEKRKEIMELQDRLHSLNKIEEVLRGSVTVLTRLRENIEKKYLNNISKKTSEYFSRLTNNKYLCANYNDNTIYLTKEHFSERWSVVDSKGTHYNFIELSDGARTQLLLSIRLALISSFLGDNCAFLLLDEPFAYFDEQREENARKILNFMSKIGWQIIMVSARTPKN